MKSSSTALCLAALFASPAAAEGDLVGRLAQAPDLVIGTGEAGYGFTQEPFTFETGKGYRMWIKATGEKECAFVAPELFQNAFFRKIEVNKVELKFARMDEIEFERAGEAELFFTIVRPGEYAWECKGLADKGLTGKIVVK